MSWALVAKVRMRCPATEPWLMLNETNELFVVMSLGLAVNLYLSLQSLSNYNSVCLDVTIV